MPITRAILQRFTAFENLDIEFSPGINVLVGENGTGKTHLMKVCYAACDVTTSKSTFGEKLVNVLLPRRRAVGRLVKRRSGHEKCHLAVYEDGKRITASFSYHPRSSHSIELTGADVWSERRIRSAYIPPKDMLANAPGFRSLYETSELHFEEVYPDILNRAFRPRLRKLENVDSKTMLANLTEIIGGKVRYENEEFLLDTRDGEIEFTLLAEGLRKLGLIWLLIQNGTLGKSSVLFWDEPETNLNPKLYKPVIETLLMLQRNGVQIFLATHEYVILKELDLQTMPSDEVAFHSLFRNRETDEIECRSTESYLDISSNAISDTFSELYDRSIERSLGKGPVGR